MNVIRFTVWRIGRWINQSRRFYAYWKRASKEQKDVWYE